MSGDWLDGVAKELARGQSRRQVVGKIGGALAVLLVGARVPQTAFAQAQCTEGQTACGKVCVDIQTDPKHCGGCKRKCPNGTTCQGGACRCPTGRELCGKKCVNTDADVKNCGQCGRKCPKKTACITGVCGGCNEDGDCKNGRLCREGRCETPPACTPACGAGAVCRNGTCVQACTFTVGSGTSAPRTPARPRGASDGLTVQFSTETSFNGQVLKLEQTAPSFGPAGQFSSTTLITLGGVTVLQVDSSGAKNLAQVTVTYGSSFFQGIGQSSFTSDGSTVQGQVNGRAIVPFSVNSPPANDAQIQFADGGPPPTVTVNPALLNAIAGLWRQAEREAESCTPATARPPSSPRNPPQSTACLLEIAGAVHANVACVAAVGATCAAFLIGVGICLGIGLTACMLAGERLRRRVAFGATCCPTKCNPGDESELFGPSAACCPAHETCKTPGSDESDCCAEGFFSCEGKACCDSVTNQTCHPGGICCNPGLSPCQGVCCATGSCQPDGCCTFPNVTCGSSCCPPFSNCCNGQCCNGECVNGSCCRPPLSRCGSTCCGNQCCNNVCCAVGESCSPITGACTRVCNPQFGEKACPTLPGYPTCCSQNHTCCQDGQGGTCCLAVQECCPGVGCCGPNQTCCTFGSTNFCVDGNTCIR